MQLRTDRLLAAIVVLVIFLGSAAGSANGQNKTSAKSKQAQDNVIDIRLNPSAMSGWEVFHLTRAQNAITPFPSLYWAGGGNAVAGIYPYQSVSGGVGGYRGVQYDALTGNGITRSDMGVWTNAGATRYFCARKKIQLTGNPKSSVSVPIRGYVDDNLHLFLRNARGLVSELCRTMGGAGNYSCTANFSTLKAGVNWVEVYATDAVFSGRAAKRYLYLEMSPVAVVVSASTGGGGGGGGVKRHK